LLNGDRQTDRQFEIEGYPSRCARIQFIFIVRHTQCYKVRIMQLTPKLHVSTPWGHLQAYKICVVKGAFVQTCVFTNAPCTTHIL